MGKRNVAAGNDRVQVQVGQVLGRKIPKPERPEPPESGSTENIRTGNATVGRQVDEIQGGFTIR